MEQEENVLLSISNEELGLHLSFWATKTQAAEIKRLTSEGMDKMDAIDQVIPLKNNNYPTT